jgi:hypothetical protein
MEKVIGNYIYYAKDKLGEGSYGEVFKGKNIITE